MTNGADGSPTTNYNFIKPVVGASAGIWGATLRPGNQCGQYRTMFSGRAISACKSPSWAARRERIIASLRFCNGSLGTTQGLRWAWIEDTSAEVGGNAGSNLALTAYNDIGALLSTPMSVARATGLVTFNNASSHVGLATFAREISRGDRCYAPSSKSAAQRETVSRGQMSP